MKQDKYSRPLVLLSLGIYHGRMNYNDTEPYMSAFLYN
jgi:hypothetical protein